MSLCAIGGSGGGGRQLQEAPARGASAARKRPAARYGGTRGLLLARDSLCRGCKVEYLYPEMLKEGMSTRRLTVISKDLCFIPDDKLCFTKKSLGNR